MPNTSFSRRALLTGATGLAAAISAGAAPSFAMPAVITQSDRAAAAEEMIAFVREELLKTNPKGSLHTIAVTLNERLIRNHPEAIDPRKRMRKAEERFGPGKHDRRFAQMRRLSGNIPVVRGARGWQCDDLIDATVADLAAEIVADERLTQSYMPEIEQRHFVPVDGSPCVDPQTFEPMITFMTRRCYAPIGTVWL